MLAAIARIHTVQRRVHRCFSTSHRPASLLEYGERVLRASDPREKVALTYECRERWETEESLPIYTGSTWHSDPPIQPARGDKPPLYPPKEMPSPKDMDAPIPVTMLHALGHIELGAIDNYWDTIVRFDPEAHNLTREFYDDFLRVAHDECRHFAMVDDRLRQLGSCYGDLPATLALLEHARNTSDDLAARMAVVPLVQEARGLDSGDRLVHKLKSVPDAASAAVVQQIVDEERGHVYCGIKWFRRLAAMQNKDPVPYFHELVLQFFPDGLPGPFDVAKRLAADMEEKWYRPLETRARADRSTQSADSSKGKTDKDKDRMAAFKSSKRRVVLAGSVWPERTSSAAGVRSQDMISILQEQGYQIVCASPSRLNQHTEELAEKQNVECIQVDPNGDGFQKLMLETAPQVVIFDRFIAEEMYSWQVKKYAPDAIRVLDLQDVHFLRKAREVMVAKRKLDFTRTLRPEDIDFSSVEKNVIRELAAIHRSDLTFYVSGFERELLTQRFQVPDRLLHLCDFFYPRVDMSTFKPFEERKDIAFIGSFKHPPNLDAIEWLRSDVMPHFHRMTADDDKAPEVHIYGSYSDSPRYKKLEDKRLGLHLKGFADDVHETLSSYRISVAPLRYGAGIKGKIADGWVAGTPSVTTSIGVEGMHLDGRDEWGGRVADDPIEFATMMRELSMKPTVWAEAQETGSAICNEKYNRERNASRLIDRLEQTLEQRDELRDQNWIGRILWSEKYRATEYMSKYIQDKRKK